MKFIFVITLMATFGMANAQDYCKLIKKEVIDNTTYNYESPYKEDSVPVMRVMRNYSTNADYEYDNFNLIVQIPCEFADLIGKTADGGEAEKEETKMIIEFEDKTKLTDDTLQVTHVKSDDGSAARVAYYPLTPQNIKTLTAKKIAKVYLASASATVPADIAAAIPQYILCLTKVKK